MSLAPGSIADEAFARLFKGNAQYQETMAGFKDEDTRRVVETLLRRVFSFGMVNGYDLGTATAEAVMEAAEKSRKAGIPMPTAEALAGTVGEAFLDSLDSRDLLRV